LAIVFFALLLYDDLYSQNSIVLNNATSTAAKIIVASGEKQPSLEFYKIMMALFLGMFSWGVKLANDRIKSKKYISSLFLFFMGYCLFSGVVFLDVISNYYLIPEVFKDLATLKYIHGILTSFIVFLAILSIICVFKFKLLTFTHSN
jgi:hypothetical protein